MLNQLNSSFDIVLLIFIWYESKTNCVHQFLIQNYEFVENEFVPNEKKTRIKIFWAPEYRWQCWWLSVLFCIYTHTRIKWLDKCTSNGSALNIVGSVCSSYAKNVYFTHFDKWRRNPVKPSISMPFAFCIFIKFGTFPKVVIISLFLLPLKRLNKYRLRVCVCLDYCLHFHLCIYLVTFYLSFILEHFVSIPIY